jgi:hypothetical protein
LNIGAILSVKQGIYGLITAEHNPKNTARILLKLTWLVLFRTVLFHLV